MDTANINSSLMASTPESTPVFSLENPLIAQGGVSVAVILAITLFVKALTELVKASHD